MLGIDPLGVSIAVFARSVLESCMAQAPKHRAIPESYSYRRIRPFPPVSPHWAGIISGTCVDLGRHAAWHEEFARREVVRMRWDLRRARRAARPPKGHDHPEWV